MRPRPRLLVRWNLLVVAVLVAATSAACSSAGPAPDAAPAEDTSVAPVYATAGGVTTVAYRTVDGVDPDLTSLDVHMPAGACAAPVVMWVHGGGYQKGDTANAVDDKVVLFGEHGWLLVSVSYRLTDPGSPTSAGFPDHADDVATAVRGCTRDIAGLGGDPARIALLGHSAGADIVANVATDPDHLARSGLGLDALALRRSARHRGVRQGRGGRRGPRRRADQWQLALGNEPDYLERTSATRLIEPGIGIPPMIGVVRGSPQRQQIETGFLAALDAAGIASTTIDARSLSHEEVNRRIGAPGDT